MVRIVCSVWNHMGNKIHEMWVISLSPTPSSRLNSRSQGPEHVPQQGRSLAVQTVPIWDTDLKSCSRHRWKPPPCSWLAPLSSGPVSQTGSLRPSGNCSNFVLGKSTAISSGKFCWKYSKWTSAELQIHCTNSKHRQSVLISYGTLCFLKTALPWELMAIFVGCSHPYTAIWNSVTVSTVKHS